MRILIVEDDRALGMFLQKGLLLEGHKVEWVGDGDAAVASATAMQPDLMVLDLSLPQRDGVEVLAELQAHFAETSVIVLTGRSQVEERVKCLNMGADDCLLKPFSLHELTARCRAILRRKMRFVSPVLKYGDLEMNRMERTLHRGGKPIELTGKEFALIEFLLLRQGDCCSRSELLTEVWKMEADSETNVVDVYINYLRKKLAAANPESGDAAVIETVRGEGYRLHDTGQSSASRPAAFGAVRKPPVRAGTAHTAPHRLVA